MGRYRKYTTVKAMKEAVEEYFDDCAGEIAKDCNGDPMYTDKGFPIYKRDPRPPTITGLAYHLGFKSRQALINYEGYSDEFHDTIMRAKLLIERYAEERLFDRDGQRGAEFSLRCNFHWRDEHDGGQSDERLVQILAGLTAYANSTDKQ